MDAREDVPQVPYATALDWFIVMCFGFVIASCLEFAGVHYFTKRGFGEIQHDSDSEDEWVDDDELECDISCTPVTTFCYNNVYSVYINLLITIYNINI